VRFSVTFGTGPEMLKNGLLPEGCSKLKSRQQRTENYRQICWLDKIARKTCGKADLSQLEENGTGFDKLPVKSMIALPNNAQSLGCVSLVVSTNALD